MDVENIFESSNHPKDDSLHQLQSTPRKPASSTPNKKKSCLTCTAPFSLATAERKNAYHENCLCSYRQSHAHEFSPSTNVHLLTGVNRTLRRGPRSKLVEERSIAPLILRRPVQLASENGMHLVLQDEKLLGMRLDQVRILAKIFTGTYKT